MTASDLKELARTQRRQRQFDAAATTLEQAIATHMSEVSDLYGMLGGTRREQGDLVAAAAAYDAGYWIESDPRYGLANSYNALNRVVTRILLRPASLSDPQVLREQQTLEFVDVPQCLAELQRILRNQVDGVRSHDYWAAGDLAVVCALNGDVEGAIAALERFRSCTPAPTPHAYADYRSTLTALAELDTPRRQALAQVRDWLDAKSSNV